ncbi:MAG: hypothetical protein ACM3UZ_01455 [Acidobacteriota bacterium]
MSLKIVRLQSSTTKERHTAINQIREALTQSGAIILDFKMFSNRTINFVFEINTENIAKLYECLQEIGLKLWQDDKPVDHSHEIAVNTELHGTLQITFIHNDPDLRIEVPPFDL